MASIKRQNEKAARERRMVSAKEKVLDMKRRIVKVVETMIEKNLSEEWFLENCFKLCHQDYEDVINERSIEKLCGYPLCNKPIIEIKKQQYHISRTLNKIYDLTERKCFCSNQCYTASNYLKAQLSEVPLYMRKTGVTIPIKLIPELNNKGSIGKEVEFQHSMSHEEVDKTVEETALTNHFADMLQKDVKEYEEQLSRLKISENTYEQPFVFNSKASNTSAKDLDEGNLSDASSATEEDSDEDVANFRDYDDTSAPSDKQMPIPNKTNKAVLISALKSSNTPETLAVPGHSTIEFIQNIFNDWFTEDTIRYLLGERKMYAMKADLLFQTMVNSDVPSNSEKLSSIKNEYIDLCLKIDKLPDEELSDCLEVGVNHMSRTDSVGNDSFPEVDTEEGLAQADTAKQEALLEKTIPKRRPKARTKGRKKMVTFGEGIKENSSLRNKVLEVVSQESEESQPIAEPTFPLIDSVSQNALRRQLLTSKLKAVYFDLLPIVGLQYRDISNKVKELVKTFSLTPTNITFKPKEWKCIAFVILRILTKTLLKELEIGELPKLWDAFVTNLKISMQQIEELASDLITAKQLYQVEGINCINEE